MKKTPEALAAGAAGLHYVSDQQRGIRRRRRGETFCYVDACGGTVHDKPTLARIRSIVIPPAWEDVWICADPRGHLQATGRDARGRKQYRYHPDWRRVRDETKYHRMIAFGRVLPRIRRRVAGDLRRRGLPREKVLATVVRLLELTLIRVGNDDYATENHSYGLTTLRDRHAHIARGSVTFRFRGKSGKAHEIKLADARLARIVKKCRDLPGQELFQYRDAAGEVVDVSSTDVNEYIHAIAGGDFTAKDFRTWAGTVLAAVALRELDTFETAAEAKSNLRDAVDRVARQLGNTSAVCRKCYIHPVILDTYLDGTLIERLQREADRKLSRQVRALRADEATVLTLLHQKL